VFVPITSSLVLTAVILALGSGGLLYGVVFWSTLWWGVRINVSLRHHYLVYATGVPAKKGGIMHSARIETTYLILLGISSLFAGLGAVLGRALAYLRLFDEGANIALLLALLALVMGGYLYRCAEGSDIVRRLALASVIAAAISLLPTPFTLVILPIVLIHLFFIWRSAGAGWRWWGATTVASAGGILAGVILSVIVAPKLMRSGERVGGKSPQS
jgi:hypothetical protein